jgi:hypothetical protein
VADFPHYQRWIVMLDGRDRGVLLIAMLVLIALGALIDVRAFLPRYMGPIRNGLLWLYYLSLAGLILLSLLRSGA